MTTEHPLTTPQVMKHHSRSPAVSRLAVQFAFLSTLYIGGAASAFCAEPTSFAFLNTPDWKSVTVLEGKDPVTIATLTLDLAVPSNVLVQFSSELVAENPAGCPCTLSATVAMDKGEQRLVKSANLASPAVQSIDKYDHDRQHLDGSTVFEASSGKHQYVLVFRQQNGTSNELLIHLPNVQAIAYAR